MIRAVLDTNVIVSGFVRRHPDAPSVRILDAWRTGRFQLVVFEATLDEVARTLNKPYFRSRLTKAQVESVLQLLRRRALLRPLTAGIGDVASHPEDDLVLDTAVSTAADVLVTGDTALLELTTFQEVAIISPRAFSDLLGPNA